jgi:hypothetical protein
LGYDVPVGVNIVPTAKFAREYLQLFAHEPGHLISPNPAPDPLEDIVGSAPRRAKINKTLARLGKIPIPY